MNDQRKGLWKTLGLIVVLVIGIMLISHPGVRKLEEEGNSRICQRNLAMIEVAKARFAIDNHLMDGDPCTMKDLLVNGVVFKEALICPSGGAYTVGALGETPTCSLGAPHGLPVKRGEAVDEREDRIK